VTILTDCTNCNKVDALNLLAEDEMECNTTVHETVCVQGTVTITPSVVSGESKSFCVGDPIIGSCPGELKRTCTFTVSQNICVQIPLTFKATASAVENGVVCGTPKTGMCSNSTKGCTHTIGFFKNHPDVTNALITAAGGSILLGLGGGLSFTVTTSNATDVLSFNVPSPPAPTDPPFANQYQVLYAQLLGAKLNVLSLIAAGVEVCQFALDAIAAADAFLSASPVGGMAGAPLVQAPLEQFNSGNASGCPDHCGDDI